MGTYKVEAQIDEHYIDRVVSGLEATFERQGETFSTSIRKVYPEVRDGKFKADFKFEGEQPDNIRSGQTYYLNLQLGQPEEAVIIPRGTFYQKTAAPSIRKPAENGSTSLTKMATRPSKERSASAGRTPSTMRFWKAWPPARKSSLLGTIPMATVMY